jgi:hypothetical protein
MQRLDSRAERQFARRVTPVRLWARLSTLPLLAVACLLTAPAGATIVVGSFEGVITDGYATNSFGFVNWTSLTGKTITGQFSYDTDLLTTACGPDTTWFSCARGAGAVTITETIDGHSELFGSSAPPAGSSSYDAGDAGVSHYTLSYDGFEVATRSLLGSAATQFLQYETHLGVALSGQYGPDVSAAPPPIYSGPAANNYAGGLSNFGDAAVDETLILGLTAGDLTTNTRFSFDISGFSVTPVPEPATWATMLFGFGLMGCVFRQRRRGLLTAGRDVRLSRSAHRNRGME